MHEPRGRRPTPYACLSCGFAALVTVTLGGCGSTGDNPLGLPSLGSVAATSSPGAIRPSATTTGGQLTAQGDPSAVAGGASAELGLLTGSAAEQPEVVQAVVDYMDVRVRIANTWQVDEAALAGVATGQAARSARQRATVMQAGDRRTVGSYVVNASRVRISAGRASVTGCMVDRTSEVDAAGQVLVDPPGGRKVSLQLERTDDRWLVSDVPVAVPPFCKVPTS